jgi:hypothetical protein
MQQQPIEQNSLPGAQQQPLQQTNNNVLQSSVADGEAFNIEQLSNNLNKNNQQQPSRNAIASGASAAGKLQQHKQQDTSYKSREPSSMKVSDMKKAITDNSSSKQAVTNSPMKKRSASQIDVRLQFSLKFDSEINVFTSCQQNDPADGPTNIENVTPPLKTEKTAYSRLRVLTAPPTSIHEMGKNPGDGYMGGLFHSISSLPVHSADIGSPRDVDASPLSYEIKTDQKKSLQNSSIRRSNLRLSSQNYPSQRISGGSATTRADNSVTQFAFIDDENVSALQQVTRGGGGALTLASQWKSQFDDSEGTTDNEWKQEPQSPDNKDKMQQSHSKLPAAHQHYQLHHQTKYKVHENKRKK